MSLHHRSKSRSRDVLELLHRGSVNQREGDAFHLLDSSFGCEDEEDEELGGGGRGGGGGDEEEEESDGEAVVSDED